MRPMFSLPLVALLGIASPAFAETELPRLDHAAIPTSETLHLTLDPSKTDYSGTATVTLQIKESTDALRFHARALTIDSATLTGATGAVAVSNIEAMPPDQASVHLARRAAPGLYTLTLKFHNRYNTRAIALYRVVTEGTGYLFTQFEDTEAREAFPCWDEPEFKIPWQVTVAVPARDLAVSNTPVIAETRSAVTKTVRFARTKPLPSYLVAICVGPFDTVPIKGLSVPGRVVTVRGASAMAAEAARVTPAILRSLEKYFGRPYPYEKLDLIAAPEFLYGAMENAGAIVFADRRLLLDPRAASPEQRRDLTSVIAHEAAHQWFGDLVTMKWWDDLWLNESFASWMATKVMDDVHPESHSGVTTLSSVERAFTTDSRMSTRAMRGKIEGRTSLGQTANELTYNKGEAVLTMFEGWLGNEKFRAGVLEYLKAHEWRNAEGRDLWLALGHQSGDDVDAAMSSFLDQPGVPLVTVEPLDGGRVKLSQRRFLTLGMTSNANERWRIPVILRYPAGGELRTQRVWLTAADTIADLGGATPAWIDANAGASGYYRWKVPDAMLDAMAAERDRLTAREKIDVVANLTAGLRAGTTHAERYLKLLARFADDPSPDVVRAVVEALSETSNALATSRSEPSIGGFIRATFDPTLKRYGMHPAANEPPSVALMRPAMMHLLARAGRDARVLIYAESLSRAFRANPTSIPASMIEPAIVLGAMRGDRALFDDYRHRFETTHIPIERSYYLAGLGSFRNPTLRAAALDYALHGPLRPHETLMIPNAMSVNSLGAESRANSIYPDDVAKWMMDHYDELRAKLPPNFASRIVALGSGCDSGRIQDLVNFFHDPKRQNVGIDQTLQRLVDSIRECSGIHSREAMVLEHMFLSIDAAP